MVWRLKRDYRVGFRLETIFGSVTGEKCASENRHGLGG